MAPSSSTWRAIPTTAPSARRCATTGSRNGRAAAWPCLTRLRVDLSTGKADSRTYDTGTANEFPVINPAYVGKRQPICLHRLQPCRPRARPAAAGRTDRLRDRHGRRHDFGPDGYAGEPLFIATQADGAEDDGVVVTLVFDAAHQRTDIVGLDARDIAARPLFVARLKHHVPFPLHGTFTPRLF